MTIKKKPKIKKRKSYSDEFKAAAVRRLGTESPGEITRDLKIGNSALYKWRQQLHQTTTPPKDAIIYLRHAREAMTADLKTGRIKKLDKAHVLMLLALEALGGDTT